MNQDKKPTIAAIIEGLRESHAATTQGQWSKGKTTHQTVAKRQAGQPYHVAEFRHADDADFCEQAHASVPKLLEYIAELEAQLEAIGAGGVEPLRKRASTADVVVADERDAFDKWLRIKPCGAAHDFGWQAWKARAALASTPVAGELATLQAGLQAAAPNAPLYDPREVAFSAQAAPQAVQAAVPVAGQSRFKGEKDWHWCSPEHVAMVAATPSEWQGYEARYLYAHAAPAHPAEGVPAPMPVLHPHHCTARTADGSCEECEGHAQAMAEWNAERTALAATHPTQQGLDRQKIDPLRQMLAQHEAHLEQNPYAYFELAYTRRTGWMVWITDKPAFRESVLVNPDRKVLWKGQGDTPDEACENAALATQAKQGGAA